MSNHVMRLGEECTNLCHMLPSRTPLERADVVAIYIKKKEYLRKRGALHESQPMLHWSDGTKPM